MTKQPTGYYRFRNLVPVAGYSWIQDFEKAPGQPTNVKPPPPPYLVPNSGQPEKEKVLWRSTYPLVQTPFLYRTFQKQTADERGALAFANAHGWLAGDTAVVETSSRHVVEVSSLRLWISELHSMQIAGHLWECLQKNDHRTLNRYLHWSPATFAVRIEVGVSNGAFFDQRKFETGPPALPFNSIGEWLVHEWHRNDLQRFGPGTGWKHGEVTGPTRLAIMNVVNERLRQYCHPRLYLGEDGKHVGMLTPIHLLGCLWLQFYQELAGIQKLRQCAICHKEMDVSENRAHKTVHLECSRRERQKRWRQKLRATKPD